MALLNCKRTNLSAWMLGLATWVIVLIPSTVHAQAGAGNLGTPETIALPTPAAPAATSGMMQSPATQIPTQPVPLYPNPMRVRIKDITYIQGDRPNHVSGEGLVMGLSGTGGKSAQTRIVASNYFLRQGIAVDNVDTKNLSTVLVSGKIPAYARKGETILVTVSVADDASSLRGGTLHRTPLRGIDDVIYAIAQGPIIGGGVSAQGAAASVQVNHPTVGVVEAIVEREIPCSSVEQNGQLQLVLRNRSYSTATTIANELNNIFPSSSAAMNSGTVVVNIPKSMLHNVPGFIAMMGDIRVTPDQHAKIVINQKTGTVILGHNVRIANVVFASENIVISTTENPVASQPAPFSQGETVVLPRTFVEVVESGGNYNQWAGHLTVGDLAAALNAMAVSPNTLVNILTSLKNQGAIQAELIIE